MEVNTTDRLKYVIQCEDESESTALQYMLTLFDLLRAKPQIPDSLIIWWSLEGVRQKLQDSITERGRNPVYDALGKIGPAKQCQTKP